MRRQRPLIAASLVAALSAAAFAHSGATGIVKERMDGMDTLAKAMKSLAGMSKTGDIDSDQVVAIAQTIKAHSGQAMTERFPEGSLPHVSEATPKIWEDWARFEAISGELFDAAARLEAEAKVPDLDLKVYMKELGATCSSCHEDFRIKK